VTRNECGPIEFDFTGAASAGLVVCAGGFEQRSRAFAARLRKAWFSTESSLLLKYENAPTEENEANFQRLKKRMGFLCPKGVETILVDDNTSVQGGQKVQKKIREICTQLDARSAFVDISAMTHLLASSSLHACLSCGLRTTVVYTEAKSYFPKREMTKKVVRAWRTRDYDSARKFLQSAGLKAVHILPDFSGNFRPGHQTCLVVFAGHEPNRLEGLVDDYAPGALIVLYGVSPHPSLRWRTELSKDLHAELFSQWHVRQREISTLRIDEVLDSLEKEFGTIRDQYDVAIAPQCSKMQAVATYLFWRRHPEIQLIFTSPVSFNPRRYSHGTGQTFQYEIS
jgi:hypothetical protein